LESFDVGKAEVGVVRVQGSASIRRSDTSCSTFHGGLRGLKVCHQHLKLKGAPALIVTYTKRSHPSWLCEIREAAESDNGVVRHPLAFLAFSGASRKEKGRGWHFTQDMSKGTMMN